MRTALIYNFLLEANIIASIAIVLMLIVRKFLRKQLGNWAIYFSWLLVAVRLLCPLALPNPAINEIRPAQANDQAIRPIAGQVKVRLSDAVMDLYLDAYQNSGHDQSAPVVENLWTLRESMGNGMLSIHLMEVYFIGCGAVLGWFIFANVRFRRRLRADRIEPISGELMEQYQSLCLKRGVKPLPVYFTDPLPSACLVGVVKPYIALPLTAAPQDAIQVLTHEICHYQGHDHWWGVVRLCCCVLHWFNPLVWLAASLSRTDGELLCDDRVVRKMGTEEKRAYAGVLVLAAAKRTAPGVPVLATGMTMTGRKLKNRVRGILGGKRALRGLSVSFVVLASLLLVCAFATAEYGSPDASTTYSIHLTGRNQVISGEADAIARAQEIARREDVQVDVETTEWSANAYDGSYRVVGVKKDGYEFIVLVQRDGSLWDLVNWGPWQNRGSSDTVEKDDFLTKELPAHLNDFMEQEIPGLAAQMKLTLMAEIDMGEERYIQYDGYVNPATSFTLTVQVEPELRIVQFSPGNG